MLIASRDKLFPKVLDFGISKLEDIESDTQTGMMMGTPQYMPPEQWSGAKNATAAADVYALGVMLFQMLCGRYPLLGDSKYSWMKKHCEEPPTRLTAYLQHPAAETLSALLDRCLAKRPEDRPQSAFALLEELSTILQSVSSADSRPVMPTASLAQTSASQQSPIPQINTGRTPLNSDAKCERCDIDHPRGSFDCPTSRIGQVVAGKYKLSSLLGAGGMGAVYQADHLSLKKQVALKMLLPRYATNELINKRFEEEARRASSLKHPGIVEVNDLGRDTDGTAYMEMELLEGVPVSTLLKGGELSIEEAVKLFTEAAEALSFAHQKGVIHRDIKPDNLFRARTSDGTSRVKIVDFGIAKIAEDTDGSLTQTGSIMGTPIYMSLEQATDSKRADARSDLYSLGATFYELLTRQRPVSGSTINELLIRLVEDKIERSPKKYRSDIPEWLNSIVIKAMAQKPEARFQSAAELVIALRERQLLPSTMTPVVTDVVAPTPTQKKKPIGLIVASAVGGVALMLGGYFLFLQEPEKPTVNQPTPATTGTTVPKTSACQKETSVSWKKAKGNAYSSGSFSAETSGEVCRRALLQAKENAIRAALCIDEADPVTNAFPPVPTGCEQQLDETVRSLSWKAQIVAEKNVAAKSNNVNGQETCEVEGEFRVQPLPEKRKCELEIINRSSVVKESIKEPEEYLFTIPESSERKELSMRWFTLAPGGQIYPLWGEGGLKPTIYGHLIDRKTKAQTKFTELAAAPLKVGSDTRIISNNVIPKGQLYACEVLFVVAAPPDKTLRVKIPEGSGEESKRLLALMSQIQDSAGGMEEACWSFLPYKIEK